MAENPFARFAEKPVEGNPFSQFAASQATAPSDDRVQSLWSEVQEGRRRFSSLPAADQDAVVRRFAPSNAGNAIAGGMMMNWADEATAGINAALETVGIGRRYAGQSLSDRYQDHKAFQDAQSRTFSADRPKTALASQVGGGIASAAALPAAALFRGATVLPQVGNAALAGLGYGAVAGAGEGNTLGERAGNAAFGAAIGTGIGAASVPIARGAANAIDYVADRFVRTQPTQLRGLERGAVDRVGRAIRDDGIDAGAAQSRAGMLGPEGMIADFGANTQQMAAGLVTQPGRAQAIVTNQLRSRAEGAPARIRSDLDATLGPARSLPDAEEAIRQGAARRAGPLYEQFRNTPVPFTREVEGTLDALRNTNAGRSAIREAMENAAIDAAAGRGARQPQFFANIADDGSVNISRVPNAQEWDYIKRALDGKRSAAERTGDANVTSQFDALSRRVRTVVDDAISPGDPQNSIWAQARRVAGEGFGLRNAMDEGRTAFSKGLSPDQMRADLGALSAAERTAYNVGARDNIRQLMGNAATKWGDNPDTAVRSALGSDNAREKLRMLLGGTNAQGVTRRLDAETAFDRTAQEALGNSRTAARIAAQAEFPGAVQGPFNQQNVGSSSLFGTAMRGMTAIVNAATGGALTERNARIAVDAARMLTAQGSARDDLVKGLLARAQQQGVSQAQKERLETIARTLIRGATPGAAGAIAPYGSTP